MTKRKVGPAWMVLNEAGEWVKRKGRPAGGHLDERAATVVAAEVVGSVEAQLRARELGESGAPASNVTFREVAEAFLEHRVKVKGSRPSTVADYRSMLAEPGVPIQRYEKDADGKIKRDPDGRKTHAVTDGFIMRRIGTKVAGKVTTRDIERILMDLADASRGPTTINKYRALLSSIYNYARRGSTFALPTNPVEDADRRRQPPPADSEFYSVEEVEALARALEVGEHRGEQRPSLTADEIRQQKLDDRQDGELVRVAAYAGLRPQRTHQSEVA